MIIKFNVWIIIKIPIISGLLKFKNIILIKNIINKKIFFYL